MKSLIVLFSSPNSVVILDIFDADARHSRQIIRIIIADRTYDQTLIFA